MEKITIKHYLNKKLKPIKTGDNDNLFPVYVRILWGREVIRIKSVIANQKSKIEDYLTDKQFNEKENTDLFIIETKIIKHIFNNVEHFKLYEDFTISNLIEKFTKSMFDEINNTLYLDLNKISNNYNDTNSFWEIVSDHLCNSIENKNIAFIEKSLNIDVRNFDLIENFDFIKKDEDLKIVCETIKELKQFETKFYSESNPLNVYEWSINNGLEKFIQFTRIDLKTKKTYENFLSLTNSQIMHYANKN